MLFFALLLLVTLVRGEKENIVEHVFQNVRVDALGWIQIEESDRVTSVTLHQDVRHILYPTNETLGISYYPPADPSQCIVDGNAGVVKINTHSPVGASFWKHNRAYVLIVKESDHTEVYKIVTLTNLDAIVASDDVTTTTTSTETPATTIPSTTTTDTAAATTSVLVATTPVPTVVTEETTSSTTATVNNDEEKHTTSHHKGGDEDEGDKEHDKATDVKANVAGNTGGTMQYARSHANVAIIALSVFGVFVLLVVVVVAIKGGGKDKVKVDDDNDVYSGYEFSGQKDAALDTRAQDLLILQSIGKGARPEFQANL